MTRRGIVLAIIFIGCKAAPPPWVDAGPTARCSPLDRPAETACRCNAKTDCAAVDPSAKWACTPSHRCTRICTSATDCQGGDVDTPVCEDLVCRPKGCGDNAECANGLLCRDGTCQTPILASAVTNCEVWPSVAVLNANGSATFRVLTFDSEGAPITYEGPVQWSSTNLNASTPDSGIEALFTASSSATLSSGQVAATIGNVRCAVANVRQYQAATSLRVVVTSAFVTATSHENAPVAGATVLLDDGTTAATNADGIVLFPAASVGAHTLSVFAEGYDYLTVVGTQATDILIPLVPSASDVSLAGQFQDTDFAGADNLNGTIHMAFAGGSFAGNVFDLSLNALLGVKTQPTTISLGTGTPYGPFPMPAGFSLGLGAQMFGENGGGHYAVATRPGRRATWALAGNTVIGDMLKAFGPLLNGSPPEGNAPPLAWWTQLVLGFLQSGDSGVEPLVVVGPSESRSLAELSAQPPMDHTRRIHLDALAPRLPPALDGLVVLAGAADPVQGFVPLGAALAMDFTGGTTASPDRIIDADTFNKEVGHLNLRVAARHSGLETVPWSVVTLAMPSMSLFAEQQVLTVAGTVTHLPNGLRQQNGAVSTLDLSQALPVPPDNAVLDETARTFTLPAAVGATLHRLDIGPPEKRWSIWLPGGLASTITIPTPPASFEDRFPGIIAGSASAGVLHTVTLGYPAPHHDAPETYDDVWQFDGVDANQLSPETSTFSVRWLSRP